MRDRATATSAALDEPTSKSLLREYGIAVPRETLARSADDAVAAARAGRRRALRVAAREIHQRLKRHMLYRVIEVQPWSRLPERRYALIAFEP